MTTRRTMTALLLALSAMALMAPTQASAQFPDRPIRLVVPYPAGGSTDLLARSVAKAMSSQLGQQVIVDNRAGGGTVVGMSHVHRSAPDGYTLIFSGATSFSIQPHLYNRLPYAVEDFVPIGIIADAPVVFVTSTTSKANTLPELLAAMRSAGSTPQVATAGTGTFSHLTAAMFFTAAGLEFKDIPYRGEAPALQDLMGGQVSMYFGNLPGCLPYINDGRIKALAVTSPQRSKVAPNIPTFVEQGMPNVVTTAWFGIMGPKGIPREALGRIESAISAAVADRDVNAQLSQQGATTRNMTQQEFREFIQRDYVRWGEVVRASKIEKTDI